MTIDKKKSEVALEDFAKEVLSDIMEEMDEFRISNASRVGRRPAPDVF